VSFYKGILFASGVAILSLGSVSRPILWAQSSSDSSSSQDKSWTSTTNSQNSMGVNPIRTGETHTQNGNRTRDTQTIQRMGPDGYEPYLDVEKETVRVDAGTVRTIQRSYAYSGGERRLVQTTEEESRTLPGGEVKTVRTTSNPDANGALQVVQKEVDDVRKTGPGAQETTTSVFKPDINGGLSESLRTDQRDTRTGEHTIQFQKTTLLKDGNGSWQTAEVRQGVIKDDGKEQTREETVSQPNSDGKLAVVRRDVTKQAALPGGETKTTSETDSVDLPGTPRESSLHPVERISTTHVSEPDGGQTTRTTVQQPNPGSPTEGMQVTVQTIDTIQPGPGGIARETRTIESFNGQNPSAIWVDIGRSDKPAAASASPGSPQAGSGPGQAPPIKAASSPQSQPKQ
jgi:hypothetical protein